MIEPFAFAFKRLEVIPVIANDVEVACVKIPVDGVEAPIGELLIEPPDMVRASVTCASDAVPVRLAKLMLSDEVAVRVYPFDALPTRS